MRYLKFWLKVISLLLLWGILLPRFVHAQPGKPDPGFGGGDGFSTVSFLTNGHASPDAITVQPDGKLVVAGGAWIPTVDHTSQLAIARFMPNGNPDLTFNGTGKALLALANMDIGASGVAILPDGKILCSGWAWNDTTDLLLLARFNANGTPDNTFDGDGIVTKKISISNEGANAIKLQPDGKIVVAGYANLTGYNEMAVIRFKPNGALDNTFGGGDGFVTTPVGESYASARDLVIQPDGKIIAAGYAVANGFEEFAVVRYNSNGTLDQTFSGDGIRIFPLTGKDDQAMGVALQADGKIVLAGYANNGLDSDSEMAVVRLTANGLPDAGFGGGTGFTMLHVTDNIDYARAVALQPDGKILLAGYSRFVEAGGTPYHFAMVRLTTTGQPDIAFGDDDGVSFLPMSNGGDFIHAMVLQADGKAVVVGRVQSNPYQVFGIARFITGATVGTNAPNVFSGKISLYPNPVRQQAMLEYELQTTEKITLNLYDLQGRFIQNILPTTEKTAGKHVETLLFASDLPSGNYLLAIESESGITTIEAIF